MGANNYFESHLRSVAGIELNHINSGGNIEQGDIRGLAERKTRNLLCSHQGTIAGINFHTKRSIQGAVHFYLEPSIVRVREQYDSIIAQR